MNMTQTDEFGCPIVSQDDKELLSKFEFWMTGIIQPTIGFLGILGNVLISVIVMQRRMRNSFNELMG